MALPLVTNQGSPFPGRDLILFLTFCAIFATLVLQGLSLPPLIRWLKLAEDGGVLVEVPAEVGGVDVVGEFQRYEILPFLVRGKQATVSGEPGAVSEGCVRAQLVHAQFEPFVGSSTEG